MIQSTKAWRKEEFSFCPEKNSYFHNVSPAIPDAPYSLYVKGLFHRSGIIKTVAIVGGTPLFRLWQISGREDRRKAFAASDAWVVSGMASGVDGSGHTGALRKNGYTCAVLGCRADICYPKSNSRIYQEILEKNGAIISRISTGYKSVCATFPGKKQDHCGSC